MKTQEIANRLIELIRNGQWVDAQNELYSDDILSVEPEGTPNGTVRGKSALAKKAEEWDGMVENVLESSISDPLVADHFITVAMKSKIQFKGMPEPVNMDEICLYQVKEGKIIKEQFFYTPMPEFV